MAFWLKLVSCRASLISWRLKALVEMTRRRRGCQRFIWWKGLFSPWLRLSSRRLSVGLGPWALMKLSNVLLLRSLRGFWPKKPWLEKLKKLVRYPGFEKTKSCSSMRQILNVKYLRKFRTMGQGSKDFVNFSSPIFQSKNFQISPHLTQKANWYFSEIHQLNLWKTFTPKLRIAKRKSGSPATASKMDSANTSGLRQLTKNPKTAKMAKIAFSQRLSNHSFLN